MPSVVDDFLLIDKPKGWTSFDVVAKIRNAYARRGLRQKVGHTGTLDPQATGLLILAVGQKTKEISTLEALDKVYTGTFRLGAKTKSYDAETDAYDAVSVAHLSASDILTCAASFLGKQLQQPPMFSATWHNGKRLYELARQGKDIPERKAKLIDIFEFEILSIGLPDVAFRLRVSKGTYIRSIAHDFGERLGVGAYSSSLRRERIGAYRVEDALSVSDAVAQVLSTDALPSAHPAS